jgi:endonuclease YncB( thermonuclease family)
VRISLPALIAGAMTALVFAPTAGAATAPCVAGVPGSPKCTAWEARIGVVEDGDTVQARIKKGGRLSPRQSVRINGLQAMEIHNYSHGVKRAGDCHSLEASRRLSQLIGGKMVRLTAQKAGSTTTGEGGRVRARRSIAFKKGGRWVDVGAIMLAEGHALWFPNGAEWASNGPYSRIAQSAAARRKRIWNPAACGAGPASTSQLQLKLKWNAEDDDAKNINGEWIRITNPGDLPVSLAGWNLRDSHFRGPRKGAKKGRGFLFPGNAVVPARGAIKVHVGRGPNSATELHWGLGETIFENATEDKTKVGDGAYLFDPRGNLRAFSMYPCRAGNCTDPLAGRVSVSARYQGALDGRGQIHEWVTIRNSSSAPISLYQYELESVPWFYEFTPRDVVQPGKAITLWIDEPHPVPPSVGSPLRVSAVPGVGLFQVVQQDGFRSWNYRDALLGDGKDVVTLRNPQGAPVACDAWGMRCPTV